MTEYMRPNTDGGFDFYSGAVLVAKSRPNILGGFDVIDGSFFGQGQRFSVKTRGAIGDGVVDDYVAIRDTITACGEAGGGKVYFPKGRYRVATSSTANGFIWSFLIGWDNIELEFDPGAEIFHDLGTNCALFVIGGCVKAARIAEDENNWINYSWFVGTNPLPGWTLTGTVAKGASSVTLATAGDAANFAVGDYVVIRTGNTTGATAVGQPDAEINKVKSISGATINLEVVTAKGYVQENYNAGSTGISSVGGGGTAAPFQLVKVPEERIMRNFKVTRGFLETRANRHMFIGNGIDGLEFDHVQVLCRGGQSLMSIGCRRGERVHDCILTHRGITGYVYAFGPDAGSIDCRYDRNEITTDGGTVFIHVHEGASRIYITENRISHPVSSGTNECIIDIRARAYDVFVLDNEFVNGSSHLGGVTVFIDSASVGGGR